MEKSFPNQEPVKKSLSFVESVMAMLKEADESKVAKFQKGAIKYCEAQIRIRKDGEGGISELKEQLEELKEEGAKSLFEVDLDRIGSMSERKKYIPDYIDIQFAHEDKVDYFKEKIEIKEAEIAKFQGLLEHIKQA